MATTDFTLRVLSVLAAAFPEFKLTDPTIAVYVADLSDLSDEALDLACAECRSTCKFFPRISELRGAAARIMSGSDSLAPAGEAWGEFLRLTSRFGHDQWLKARENVANPVLIRTIESMGWFRLYVSENSMADRARFCELYDVYAARRVRDRVAPPQVSAASERVAGELRGLAKQLSTPKESVI